MTIASSSPRAIASRLPRWAEASARPLTEIVRGSLFGWRMVIRWGEIIGIWDMNGRCMGDRLFQTLQIVSNLAMSWKFPKLSHTEMDQPAMLSHRDGNIRAHLKNLVAWGGCRHLPVAIRWLLMSLVGFRVVIPLMDILYYIIYIYYCIYIYTYIYVCVLYIHIYTYIYIINICHIYICVCHIYIYTSHILIII